MLEMDRPKQTNKQTNKPPKGFIPFLIVNYVQCIVTTAN